MKLNVTLSRVVAHPADDLVGREVVPPQAGHHKGREENDEQKLTG